MGVIPLGACVCMVVDERSSWVRPRTLCTSGRAQETILSGLSGGIREGLTKCGDLDTKTKEGKMEMKMEMMGREMTGVEQGGTSIVGRLCLHLTR